MDIDEIQSIVAAWAETQPHVVKVWLFGSRVRGTERPDSDIDIAVEVRRQSGDTSAWTTFIFEKDGLRASIQPLVPVPVQLEWYGGEVETPTIHAALQESSMLVYEVV